MAPRWAPILLYYFLNTHKIITILTYLIELYAFALFWACVLNCWTGIIKKKHQNYYWLCVCVCVFCTDMPSTSLDRHHNIISRLIHHHLILTPEILKWTLTTLYEGNRWNILLSVVVSFSCLDADFAGIGKYLSWSWINRVYH